MTDIVYYKEDKHKKMRGRFCYSYERRKVKQELLNRGFLVY